MDLPVEHIGRTRREYYIWNRDSSEVLITKPSSVQLSSLFIYICKSEAAAGRNGCWSRIQRHDRGLSCRLIGTGHGDLREYKSICTAAPRAKGLERLDYLTLPS